MDVDVVDGVTVMRMNHPPVNAMDLELVDTAVATIRDVDGPIVLTGTGKCFSAGAAMKEQLHRPVHAMIDSSADMDAKVRASWLSEETRAGVAAFMDALK